MCSQVAFLRVSDRAAACPDCHCRKLLVIIGSDGGEKSARCLQCWIDRLLKHGEIVVGRRMGGRKQKLIKKSRKREDTGAGEIGGERCSGSGSGIVKGDFRNDEWVVEDKFTEKATFTLTGRVLDKIGSEALKTRRKPALRVGVRREEYAVTRWSDFLELIREPAEACGDSR